MRVRAELRDVIVYCTYNASLVVVSAFHSHQNAGQLPSLSVYSARLGFNSSSSLTVCGVSSAARYQAGCATDLGTVRLCVCEVIVIVLVQFMVKIEH